MEDVESILILVKLHLIDRLLKLISLLFDHLLSFLDLFLLVLELLDLLIDLLLHHLKKILMLNLELVHYPSERLFELVNFFIELLSHLHLQLVVQVFIDSDALVVFVDLDDHLLDHLLHLFDLRGDLDDVVLHLGMLQDTFRAEHGSVVLAIELDLFGGMNLAISNCVRWLVLVGGLTFLRVGVLDSHG